MGQVNRMVYFKQWESTQSDVGVGFYLWLGVKPSSVNLRCGKTAALGKSRVISVNKLASNPTFQIRAFDLCFVLLNGCVYVVAVPNTARVICYGGPSQLCTAMQWQFWLMSSSKRWEEYGKFSFFYHK